MIDRQTMYHAGHRTLQDRYDGRRVADALERHRRLDAFGPQEIALIEGAAFFFLATAHGQSVDCSFKGGPPGFVRVTGPTELEWPDFDGNSMYRSLGNLSLSPGVGMLFMRLDAAPVRLRVNGAAALVEDHPRLGDYPGARVMVRVAAREIFPNCPRYIPDLGTDAPSPFLPLKGKPLAAPDWKGRSYIRGILPKDDPHRE